MTMHSPAYSRRLRNVKLLHTVMWAFFAGCIVALPIVATTRQFQFALLLIAVVGVEVLVLLANRLKCPLTSVAEKYTDERQDNFDIYLPLWLARYNKHIFGALYVLGVFYTALLWYGTRPSMAHEWSMTGFFLATIAVPTATASLLGYACAPRRATKAYLGIAAALTFMAAAAWTFIIYLGNGPTHYEPIGPDFAASLIIFPSLALLPAACVYSCVSGVVARHWIVPMALLASILALPIWLWICLMVLHYVVGGM